MMKIHSIEYAEVDEVIFGHNVFRMMNSCEDKIPTCYSGLLFIEREILQLPEKAA